MRYWKRLNPDSSTRTVESYSHDLPVSGAMEITEAEFNSFLASLPPPPPPTDWKALYQAATTQVARLQVIAKMLNLE